jgi:predicted transcriptional regulator
MTLIELKKSIHKKVDDLDDPDFLELVNTLIDNKGKVFEIPEEHLAGIEQGGQDIKNGDFITLEEFEKRYEKWLKD